MVNLANQLQLLRQQKGITQEELARELGVTTGAVSKWENGKTVPDIFMLCELADFFQVTTDELLGRAKTQEFVICDDAYPVRKGITRILEEYGCRHVKEAENGAKLMELMAESVPFCVFLDIGLPDGSGLELLREIKQKYSGTKVIMVTADNSEDSRQKAVEYGAEGYITKPFLDQAVLLVLDQLT